MSNDLIIKFGWALVLIAVVIVIYGISAQLIAKSNASQTPSMASNNREVYKNTAKQIKPVYYCPSKSGTPYYSYSPLCLSRDINIT